MRDITPTYTSTSTRYQIRIRGYLDESWSDRLAGMTITFFEEDTGIKITTLCGDLLDQAALFGVLNALYDMRLPLLSVERLDVSRYD